MMTAVFIEPHERYEAVDAYRDRLTQDQIEQIEEAPESAIIRVQWNIGNAGTIVTVICEG